MQTREQLRARLKHLVVGHRDFAGGRRGYPALLESADIYLRTQRPGEVYLPLCTPWEYAVAEQAQARGIPYTVCVPSEDFESAVLGEDERLSQLHQHLLKHAREVVFHAPRYHPTVERSAYAWCVTHTEVVACCLDPHKLGGRCEGVVAEARKKNTPCLNYFRMACDGVPFAEAYTDLWQLAWFDALGVTTNGVVTDAGLNIMGRGVAKEAASRYVNLPATVGGYLQIHGNRCFLLRQKQLQVQNKLQEEHAHEPYILTFPTKQDWKRPSSLQLIRKSAEQAREIATKFNLSLVALPRPGCGNEGLSWEEDVLPLLRETLDERFVVVSR